MKCTNCGYDNPDFVDICINCNHNLNIQRKSSDKTTIDSDSYFLENKPVYTGNNNFQTNNVYDNSENCMNNRIQ